LQDENAANASQIKKLDESVSEMKAKVDEVSNGASVKTVNEIKSQLDAQNDKLIKMEKQLKSTRTIAIMGLIAGITGIVLAFVIK
jgi:flagellar hook-associated protein FlgK